MTGGNKNLACDLISETLLYLSEKQNPEPIRDPLAFYISTMKILSFPNREFSQLKKTMTEPGLPILEEPVDQPSEPTPEINLSCLMPHEKMLIELVAGGHSAAKIARELKHDGVEIHEKLISNIIDKARKKARQWNQL